MAWKAVAASLGIVLLGLVTTDSVAQTFPSRPVRLIVNAPPGGPTDLVGRMVAARMTESMGQPVVIDNRPGGGAQIAVAQLMLAPPDGHTLFAGDIGAFAINPSLYANLAFDPLRDFQPISTLMSSPSVLVVPAASAATSIDELLARAKVPQGRLTFASPGMGTGSHLLAEVFKMRTGANLVHVPYKGSAAATQAVLTGEVDMMFQVLGSTLPHAKAGKVKMLAIAAPARSPRAPEVPTTAELGYPDVHMSPWFGLVTRAGTPEAIVRRLHGEVTAALNHPATAKQLADVGFDPLPSSPEQFGSFMRAENARWGAVVRASGVRAE